MSVENKGFIVKELPRSLQILPITLFLAYARFFVHTSVDWRYAFFVGGGVALVQSVLFFYNNVSFDRFVVAINLFLTVGAGAFLFEVVPLLQVYGRFSESVLFFWVIVVGVFTTLFFNKGFVDAVGNQQKVRFASLILLAASCGACVFSYVYSGSTLLAGTLPFVVLVLLRKYIVKNFVA